MLSPIRSALVFVACLSLGIAASCRCSPPRTVSAEGALRLDPTALAFGTHTLGTSTGRVVSATNEGRAERQVLLTVVGPFVVDDTQPVLPAGTTQLQVRFEPRALGEAVGSLTLTEPGVETAPLTVALTGVAIAVPECQPAACHVSRFDVATEACVTEQLPDDTQCASACLAQGTCVAGQCLGTVVDGTCDDHDPCTLDACTDDGGCLHVARACPVSDPCLAAYCDPASGCASAPLADGTPCGASTCREAHVCMNGACAVRGRPNAVEECTAVDIAASGQSTCVLTRAGTVRCWGAGYASGYRNIISSVGTLPFAQKASSLSMAEATCVSLQSGGFQCFDRAVLPAFDAGAGARVLGVANNASGACWLLSGGAVQCVSGGFAGGPDPFDAGIRSLAAAYQSFCATRDDGGVVCWGDGYPPGALADIGLDAPALAVRVGREFDCATLVDGVSCWQHSGAPSRLPAEVADVALPYSDTFGKFVGLAADGGVLRCARLRDGGSECGPHFDAGALPAIRRAAVGAQHECFLSAAGDVACSGSNYYGELSDLSPAPPGARQVAVSDAVLLGVSIGNPGESVAVVQRDGGVLLWGSASASPVRVPLSGAGALDLVVMTNAACVLSANGRVECWDGVSTFSPSVSPLVRFIGSDGLERLGSQFLGGVLGVTAAGNLCSFALDRSYAACAPAATGLVQQLSLFENDKTTCQLLSDAGVECEGSNQRGRLGRGNTTELYGRGPVAGLAPVRKLGMTQLKVCALESSGRIQCWGMQNDGTVVPATPVPALLPFARDLACGLYHCCALVGENGVSCWGSNQLNQLGREGGPSETPLSVPMPVRVEQLSAGGYTTCARLQGGDLWCWGDNHTGQLGFAPRLESAEPVWVTQ